MHNRKVIKGCIAITNGHVSSSSIASAIPVDAAGTEAPVTRRPARFSQVEAHAVSF